MIKYNIRSDVGEIIGQWTLMGDFYEFEKVIVVNKFKAKRDEFISHKKPVADSQTQRDRPKKILYICLSFSL